MFVVSGTCSIDSFVIICQLQSRLKNVQAIEAEAKNFVPYREVGAWGGGSQWCNRLLRTNGPVVGVVLGKGAHQGGGGDVTRLANEESARVKGPDACLLLGRVTRSPAQKHSTTPNR